MSFSADDSFEEFPSGAVKVPYSVLMAKIANKPRTSIFSAQENEERGSKWSPLVYKKAFEDVEKWLDEDLEEKREEVVKPTISVPTQKRNSARACFVTSTPRHTPTFEFSDSQISSIWDSEADTEYIPDPNETIENNEVWWGKESKKSKRFMEEELSELSTPPKKKAKTTKCQDADEFRMPSEVKSRKNNTSKTKKKSSMKKKSSYQYDDEDETFTL